MKKIKKYFTMGNDDKYRKIFFRIRMNEKKTDLLLS